MNLPIVQPATVEITSLMTTAVYLLCRLPEFKHVLKTPPDLPVISALYNSSLEPTPIFT